MTGAGSLMQAGQALLRQQCPGSVTIDGQAYDCAVTSVRKEGDFGDLGGPKTVRRISFWMTPAQFEAAGQPLPIESRTYAECTAPASHAGRYLIEAVIPDANGGTLILRGVAPSQ